MVADRYGGSVRPHADFIRHAVQVTDSEAALVVEFEIGGIDDQGVAFPMAARIAGPLADVGREVRTSIQPDDAGFVIHFNRDGHDAALCTIW